MKIEIYSKTTCPFCHRAKEYLTQAGIEFKDIILDDDDDRNTMYDYFELTYHERTVPQIFVIENDGRRYRIGGYTDLLRSDVVARFNVGEFDVDF